jgi:hypothetical protein
MVGEPFDLFCEPVRVQTFDGLQDPAMQGAPALLEEAAVGDLVGEAVLEGVGEIREETGLVQELGGLEVREAAAQGLLGQVRDGLEEGEGDILPDHRRGLEEALLLGGQPVDPGRQDRLAVAGTWMSGRALARR